LQKLLRDAWAGLGNGDLPGAWRCCQALLKRFPGSAAGLDVSSRVALAMGQRRLATDLAARAVRLDGANFAYLAQQAFCLIANRDLAAAIELIENLSQRPPETAAEEDTLGNLFSQAGDQQRALACFKRSVALDPDRAHHWMNLALSLQATGDLEEAERAFDRCIALDPGEGEAWLHRSRLRTQADDHNHVDALQRTLGKGKGDWRTEMTLRYALAKELEDLGRYPESFTELGRGSSLRRSRMQHDASADLEAMEAIQQVFSREYLQQNVQGHASQEPIFIVGLPRTGTTLVERILGSHSDVFAAGELNNFAENLTALVAPLKPKDRMDFIRLAAQVDSEELGRNYVASTRPQTGVTPRFVDKLPLNFLYCGLIHRALPRAKIVHLKRNPMDACYAIYKTLFKQAYPFSYDLQELGNYCLAYRALMEHWHQLMPGAILDVEYEALATDTQAQTHRLLEFCELPWQDACVNFHRNAAPSMTASLAQVRQPVYTSSIGKWQHYEQELSELRKLLEVAGVNTGYPEQAVPQT
jgi:tetratricopeptide (TPR) repeat protein